MEALVRFGFLLGALLFGSVANGADVAVSPAWVDGTVIPGRANAFHIGVINSGAGEMTFEAILTDVWYDDETMEAIWPPAGSTPQSSAAFADIFPMRMTVAGGESGAFTVTLRPPEDFVGGMYGAVYIHSITPNTDLNSTRMATGLAFRVPMLLNSTTGIVSDLRIVDLVSTPPDALGVGQITATITNEGNGHVRPTIQGVLRNESGGVIGTMEGVTDKYFLPGQTRDVSFDWTATLVPADYEWVGAVRYGLGGVLPFAAPLSVPIHEALPGMPTTTDEEP